jgi:hypothetical protein
MKIPDLEQAAVVTVARIAPWVAPLGFAGQGHSKAKQRAAGPGSIL